MSQGAAFFRQLDRGVRLVAWIAIFGAGAGAAYGWLGRGQPFIGAAAGACNGALLSFLEIFVLRRWARDALLRLPYAVYFALRVGLYVAAVLALNLATLSLTGGTAALAGIDRRDVQFSFAVSVAVNLLFSVNELLGPGVLFAFAAGRYRRPRREERVLLYIDLIGSTGLAERLGEERFLDLLNAFYADVTSEIVAEGGEIHKYVGDEVIAVWREGTDPMQPIRATFAARRRLGGRGPAYRAEFGETPAFRAAIHAGAVVIGELGAQKKEIALIGDAMNTAARILEAARETGASALISAPYFDRLGATPPGFSASGWRPSPCAANPRLCRWCRWKPSTCRRPRRRYSVNRNGGPMLFVATCTDKPNSSALRQETRPRHLAYLNGLGPKLRVGGALLSADGASVLGSMLILEGADEAEIKAMLAQDPYAQAGLFASVDVKPWRQAVGVPLS